MNNEQLVKLSNLSEQFVRARIGELRRENLALACIDDLKTRLFDLIGAYVSSTITIAEGKSIFRARKHRVAERDTKFGSVMEIYPDARFITHLNRASREHEPIFYFSADSVIALNEVKADAGDTCTVIECKPRSGAGPFLIPIGVHDMARKQKAVIGGGLPEPSVRIKAHLQSDNEFRKYEQIDEFLSAEFLRIADEEHQYKLTIAMAELLFDFQTDDSDDSRIDGIAYPSIASGQINANLAIRPEAFHRIYRPVACTRVKIAERRPNCGFAISDCIQAKHVDAEGSIVW
jgi:hypothetical protein